MTHQIDNRKIGTYIAGLIERNFKSVRQFCKVYLQTSGINAPTGDDIQKMANRLSQIKKGAKAIQIYDLPIFSELLHVSYEQILSAGECGESNNNRMTNYTIAQSHNESEWIAYIEEKDKPILNPDEYGKTILEYAIMFGNYDFIKFLVNKNYIWFDSRKDKDYIMTFGAGTSIQRIKFEECDNGFFIRQPDMDDLQYKLATEDQLRMYIISFAADHNDLSMLDKLRAREIPELYYKAHYLSCACPDFDIHYDKNMVSHIAKSSDKVLDYFTDPFEIRDRIRYKDGSNRKHIFMFPYISQLLDMLIENNSPFLKTALEKSLKHNESTKEKLINLIKESIVKGSYAEDYWRTEVHFHENGNIIHFREPLFYKGIITNIAKVTKESADDQINQLIQKLNDSYNGIKYITEEEMA
ncbi:MAG: ankyrin repeat domain-containing protein [Clostridium sp.]|nr:ankyrin repeat domain-containing protein [Acetatifactor muris]MCM1526887.1 ankyrin repeat domain-containing protein [Bacteroides sp.]MCM1563320.1 ankyrin repeat domain-containing protein [Clostridium sp.]